LNIKNEYGGVTRNYQKGIKKMADVALKWCKGVDKKIKALCVYFSGYTKEKLEYIKDYLSYTFSVDKKNIDIRWVPNTVLVHTKLGAYGFCILLN
jgi:fatty acid-binding protein DegV